MQATEREFAVRALEAESARLREALDRVDDGSYGTCVECEEAVKPARLAAVPWAALCIHCQEAVDSGYGAGSARQVFALAA
jgi:DnaK suppressor protein